MKIPFSIYRNFIPPKSARRYFKRRKLFPIILLINFLALFVLIFTTSTLIKATNDPTIDKPSIGVVLFLALLIMIAFLYISIIIARKISAGAKIFDANRRKYPNSQGIYSEEMEQVYKFAEFGKLSGGLFHDLTNSLTAISLNIEKIKQASHQDKRPDGIKKEIEMASRATIYMQNFVESVRRQISQNDRKENFMVVKELRRSIDLLTHRARKNQILMILKTKREFMIDASPVKFNQIITNLLSNAIDSYGPALKFNRCKKTIEIDLKEKKERIVISVKDYGSGIPKPILNKIFNPFFTTKDYAKGTGIGLFLTKQIVENYFGGKIRVNTKEGKGSEFMVIIPKKLHQEHF